MKDPFGPTIEVLSYQNHFQEHNQSWSSFLYFYFRRKSHWKQSLLMGSQFRFLFAVCFARYFVYAISDFLQTEIELLNVHFLIKFSMYGKKFQSNKFLIFDEMICDHDLAFRFHRCDRSRCNSIDNMNPFFLLNSNLD